MATQTFAVLTMNVALMRILGYEPVRYVNARLAALPRFLKTLGADVLCLQEVWSISHFEQLRSALADAFPYSVTKPFDGDSTFNWSGLCIFSREEIERPAGIVYDGFPAAHEYLSQKGALSACVHTPLGLTAVVNTHLVSGGPFFKPNGRSMRKMRNGQIADLVHFADAQPGETRLVFGDLNAGPIDSSENYRAMLDGGYADAWERAPDIGRTVRCTWDKLNIFNEKDVHGSSDRIDHAFVARREMERVRVRSCNVVFNESVVDIGKGKTVPLSDHNGLLTVFERR